MPIASFLCRAMIICTSSTYHTRSRQASLIIKSITLVFDRSLYSTIVHCINPMHGSPLTSWSSKLESSDIIQFASSNKVKSNDGKFGWFRCVERKPRLCIAVRRFDGRWRPSAPGSNRSILPVRDRIATIGPRKDASRDSWDSGVSLGTCRAVQSNAVLIVFFPLLFICFESILKRNAM